jgi:hypothetical protein
VFGVIADRPDVTVTEIAQVTGIAKPLIHNTKRAGVERGELERVTLPDGQRGFPDGRSGRRRATRPHHPRKPPRGTCSGALVAQRVIAAVVLNVFPRGDKSSSRSAGWRRASSNMTTWRQ